MTGSSWKNDLKGNEEEEECNTCDALGALKQKVNTVTKVIENKQKSKNEEDDKNFWEMKTPPDVIELGQSTWTLLHTMAAYYPQNPASEKKEQVNSFLEAFSKVYPCSFCAKDFQNILKESPPQLDSQRDFSQWLCRAHNHVNKQLGKPEFDCSKVDQRWKANLPHKE